jgi:hypothetical protein
MIVKNTKLAVKNVVPITTDIQFTVGNNAIVLILSRTMPNASNNSTVNQGGYIA